MAASKPLPKRSELVDFQHAVAGHAGTLSDPDGLLFIKPCTQDEIDFYEAAHAGHPELADLMPLYMGTLMLNDAADTEAMPPQVKAALSGLGCGSDAPAAAPVPAAPTPAAAPDNDTWVPRGTKHIVTDRAIVMKNTTHGYRKPNVLDIKLGQRLWADDAPRQKRVKMDEVRAQTTHDKLGFRIAGMRVYGGGGPGGGDAAAEPDPGPSMTVDAAGYRVYGKEFGHHHVDDGNVAAALRQFLFVEAAGVDADHARALAQAFKTQLERARDVLEREHTRMYSASLLFVYEGDGPALRAAVAAGNAAAEAAEAEAAARQREQKQKQHETDGERPQKRRRRGCGECGDGDGEATAPPETATATTTEAAEGEDAWTRPSRSRREPLLGQTGDRSTSRTDSGIAMEEDEEGGNGTDLDSATYAGSEEEGNDDDSDDDDDDDLPRVCDVRLIDFAHAKFVGGDELPDENNLVGIRSLIAIFGELAR